MADIKIATKTIANCQMLYLAQTIRGLTNKQLAEKVGISTRLVADYMYGRKPITPEHLAKYAEVLQFPIKFFSREGEVYPSYFHSPDDDKPLREQCHDLIERLNEDDLGAAFAALDDLVGEVDQERAAAFRPDHSKPPRQISKRRMNTFVCHTHDYFDELGI